MASRPGEGTTAPVVVRGEEGWPRFNLPLADVVGRDGCTYTLEKQLGEGFSGRVYRASCQQADNAGASTACVVKVFKLLENGDDYCNDYFNRDTEVTALRTAAGVPHTVEFVSSFEDPRIGPYLVTRPVCHSNLEGYLKSRRESKPEPQLSLLHVITFIVQLVETGHRLHERKLVHGDIAPRNVLVEEGFKGVRLTDFGIAEDAGHVAREMQKNRSSFMAPEVCDTEAGQRLTSEQLRQSDAFAVGALGIALLSQKHDLSSSAGAVAAAEPGPLGDSSARQPATSPLFALKPEDLAAGMVDTHPAGARVPDAIRDDVIAVVLSLVQPVGKRISLADAWGKLGRVRARLEAGNGLETTSGKTSCQNQCCLLVVLLVVVVALGSIIDFVPAVLLILLLSVTEARRRVQRRLGEQVCGVLVTETHVRRVGPGLSIAIAAAFALYACFDCLWAYEDGTASLGLAAVGIAVSIAAALVVLIEDGLYCWRASDGEEGPARSSGLRLTLWLWSIGLVLLIGDTDNDMSKDIGVVFISLATLGAIGWVWTALTKAKAWSAAAVGRVFVSRDAAKDDSSALTPSQVVASV